MAVSHVGGEAGPGESAVGGPVRAAVAAEVDAPAVELAGQVAGQGVKTLGTEAGGVDQQQVASGGTAEVVDGDAQPVGGDAAVGWVRPVRGSVTVVTMVTVAETGPCAGRHDDGDGR